MSLARLQRLPDSCQVLHFPKGSGDEPGSPRPERIDAMEYVARVLALIPPPRKHLVRYHGFCSSAARGTRRRRQDTELRPETADAQAAPPPDTAAARKRWADLQPAPSNPAGAPDAASPGSDPDEATQARCQHLSPARQPRRPISNRLSLDASPLDDTRDARRIRAVVADAQLLRRADIDRLLARVEDTVMSPVYLAPLSRIFSMIRRPLLYSFCALSAFLFLRTTVPLGAQPTEVPRTRTFSGLVAPPFPYAQPEEVGISSAKLDWLGDEIVGWITRGELVGAELLIVKDEKAIFHEAYGWSDRERKVPVERNSIWSIKSMSKPFTAMAVLMLVEEGRLSLADPVSRYIPAFRGDPRTTVHHLLCQTSGYHGNHGMGGGSQDFASLRDWVESWAAEGPTEPFGEFSYSDFNYAALGSIVKEVSGLPIETFTEERIIDPLGLGDTSTSFSADPTWRARLNPWYRWNERARGYDLRWTRERQPWRFYAAGWGLFSTAMDYAKFMTLWLHRGGWKETRLLASESVERALQSHARVDEDFAYGYGWWIDGEEAASLPAFGHGGGDGTESGAYPEDDAVVVFLTHSRWGPWVDGFWNRLDMSGVFERRAGYGLNGFMDWAQEHDVNAIELAAEERSRYHGVYLVSDPERTSSKWWPSWGQPESLTVWEESGLMHVRTGKPGLSSGERFHLVPVGRDRFAVGRYDEGRLEAVTPGVEIRFRSTDGAITAIDVLDDQQLQFSAKRAPSSRLQPALEK